MIVPNTTRDRRVADLWEGHITADPAVLQGKPCIAGTRISVELVLQNLAAGHSVDEILEAYPHLRREQVLAAIEFTLDVMRDVAFYPLPEHKP